MSSADMHELDKAHHAALEFVDEIFMMMKEQAEQRRDNLKKYKDINVISIGEDCFARIVCAQWGLRKFSRIGEQSVPFDISIHPALSTASLLDNDFEGYLDKENLVFHDKTKFCSNERYKILFNHEIGEKYAANDFALLRSIYTKRMETFNAIMSSDKLTVLVLHSMSPNKNTSLHLRKLWKSIESRWGAKSKLMICINTWRLGTRIKKTEYISDHVAVLDIHYPVKNYIWFKPYFSYSRDGYGFEKQVVSFIKNTIEQFVVD